MMRTLLTIDWDAFFEEDPMWDISHKENAFFANTIWQFRSHLVHEYKLDPFRDKFWSLIDTSQAEVLFVSDSHLDAHHLLRDEYEVDHVMLVDAHHDMWPLTDNDDGSVRVDCGNWLRYWQKNTWGDIDWYQPEWASELFPLPDDMAINTKVWDLTDFPPVRPDVIHVCRSGSWAPPWLDEEFLKFVREPGLDIEALDGLDYLDPFEVRMTREQALAVDAERQKARDMVMGIQKELDKQRGIAR